MKEERPTIAMIDARRIAIDMPAPGSRMLALVLTLWTAWTVVMAGLVARSLPLLPFPLWASGLLAAPFLAFPILGLLAVAWNAHGLRHVEIDRDRSVLVRLSMGRLQVRRRYRIPERARIVVSNPFRIDGGFAEIVWFNRGAWYVMIYRGWRPWRFVIRGLHRSEAIELGRALESVGLEADFPKAFNAAV